MTDSETLETIRDGLHDADVERRRQTIRSLLVGERTDPDWAALEPLVDDLVVLLDDDPFVRKGAAIALQQIGSLEPDQVSQVDALFGHDDPTVEYLALDVVHSVSADSPSVVAPTAPSMVEILDTGERRADRSSADDDPDERGEPTESQDSGDGEEVGNGERTDETAGDEPEDDQHEQTGQGRRFHAEHRMKALEVLNRIAAHDSEPLVPRLEELLAIVTRDDDPHVRTDVLALLATVAEDHPDDVEPAIDPVSEVLRTATDPNLRANAAYLLAMLAEDYQRAVTDTVVDSRDVLYDMLESDHDVVQNASIGVLSYAAELRPETVEPALDAVFDLLDHPLESVRGNAIWTLTYVGGDRVVDRLETVAQTDPSEDIRAHAAEASASLAAE